jgi:exosortase
MTNSSPSPRLSPTSFWTLVCAALGLCLAWAYWPAFTDMATRWSTEERYSHGYFVPLFALALLVFRKSKFPDLTFQINPWGLLWIAGGLALYMFAGLFFMEWVEGISLIPTLIGICLLLGGKPALHWAGPAIGFLVFMIPLPFTLERALAGPLQRGATVASTYVLQTFGFPALSEGNIIVIDNVRVGVVEACNGLSMLLTFFALATAVVFIIERPLADKLFILASAIPIALVTNLIRITVTAMLKVAFDGTDMSKKLDAFVHDYAGLAMMPIALGLLALELWLLSRLLVPLEEKRPLGLSVPNVPPGLRQPLKEAVQPAPSPLKPPPASAESAEEITRYSS